MSVTFQELREMMVYPCRPKDVEISPEELAWRKQRIERAIASNRAADEAAGKGNADVERILRDNACFFMYGVARRYFFRFDDPQRTWYCLVAARLALAAGKPIHAMECCEAGLLQADEENEKELRELLERARAEIARGTAA